jgi:hypothetical protein
VGLQGADEEVLVVLGRHGQRGELEPGARERRRRRHVAGQRAVDRPDEACCLPDALAGHARSGAVAMAFLVADDVGEQEGGEMLRVAGSGVVEDPPEQR